MVQIHAPGTQAVKATPAEDGGLPLLSVKVHAPVRRGGLVARSRLRDLVSRRGPVALTLVSAPAGFGKSTLLADLYGGRTRTAWLGLDPRDDDPARFWAYVVAALRTVEPGLGDEARELLRAPQPPIDAVVATLSNDLARLTEDLVLILDDYHVIEAPEVHDSVVFLLSHLPRPLRLVIATRADPPLPLAAMRARGELAEVRAADLRFTPEEATSYLNDAMDLDLAPSDVDALGSRTEGWIAALQLAALSLQGHADPATFVAEFTGDDRFILDYLADEVLERQSAEVRDFLLDTSILGRLTGPLCAAVTDRPGAKATLEHLDRANLFLVASDDRRTSYRYHHLFRDVLRARLLDEHGDRVSLLHRRASDWFAADGDAQEAVAHAMAADDPARAAELVERAAPAMHRARQEVLLRSWLEALPKELFADRPVLTTFLVGARMATGDPTGIEPLLDSVEGWLRSDDRAVFFDDEEYARLPAMVAIYRAGLALLTGDPDGTVLHATRALGLARAVDHLQRGAAAALLGLALWTRGDLDGARHRYAEAVACFELGDHLPDLMGCSLALTDIQITQGRIREARRTFEAALRHTLQHQGLRGAADMHVGLAGLAIECNDLDEAAVHLRASTDLGDHMGLPQHAYRRRVAAARLQHARGDLDGALVLLEEAAPLYDTDFSPSVRPVAAMRARVQVELGDTEAGSRWVDDQQLSPHDEASYAREFEHLTLARLLLARGLADRGGPLAEQAAGLLDRLLVAADEGGRSGSCIEILVLLAAAHHASDRRATAMAALERALGLAQPEGHVRTFLDAGAPITDLLRRVDGDAEEQAARILAAAASGAGSTEVARRSRPAGPDDLSERELDVLRLLRSDLSGPEIARELHVSVNTFRTHTKHIFTKLGATTRREAVRRAAQLGL